MNKNCKSIIEIIPVRLKFIIKIETFTDFYLRIEESFDRISLFFQVTKRNVSSKNVCVVHV